MGATLKNAISAISIYGSSDGSNSHPPKNKRIKSIELGWNNGFSGYNPIKADTSINIKLLNPNPDKEVLFVNSAISFNKSGNFSQAGKLLLNAYEYSGNEDYLYYSASSYVNAKSYNEALKYYLFLIKKGYTGVTLEYFITEKKSNKEVKVSEEEFNSFKSLRKYSNPRVKYSESRQPEIFKNTSLIYIELQDYEKANFTIKKARELNPDDLNLILSEADLSIKLGNKMQFKKLMDQAVSKDPNNAILYYNLAVISGEQGEIKIAKEYYLKSLELDDTYKATYLNLAGLILSEENKIVEEMNKSYTSDYDYNLLNKKRLEIYKSALPYLLKLLEIDPNNYEALKTAKNIYSTIGDKRKENEITKKLKSAGIY
jgi:tetratricopeptide (TPR) repeat protein